MEARALSRGIVLLCLILATSGPMLRHWEAAHDLALSLAELALGDDFSEIEPVDDEIGDDPDLTILKASNDLPLAHAWVLSALSDGLTIHSPPAPPCPGRLTQFRTDRPPPQPAGSSERHARLQCYLI